MFDYKGYSEKKLQQLCCDKYIRREFAKNQYGVSGQYSMGKIYREYGNFPWWKKLYIYSEHGVEFDITYPHEVDNDAECMFVFSDAKLNDYKKHSDKPVYKVQHPFVWYRRHHNITQDKNAVGTIAFPAHATPDITCEFNIYEYIKQLKSLPKKMQPVCVCLFMTDIHNGLHKYFIESGIPVYTAGHVFDERFVDRYYEILRHFKYSISNDIGTYAFYSVEMGIPFSIVGAMPTFINVSDPNVSKGIQMQTIEQAEIAKKLFNGMNTSISAKQKDFVINKLGGYNEYLSNKQMHELLVSVYKQRGCTIKDFFQSRFRKLKYFIKKAVQCIKLD